jgi:hypothetical protein
VADARGALAGGAVVATGGGDTGAAAGGVASAQAAPATIKVESISTAS